MFYFIHKYSGGFDMLFLSEQEMWQSVTLEDVMDAIEDAYAIHKAAIIRCRIVLSHSVIKI